MEPFTVLLVEDDPNDVLLVRRAFRRAGLPEPWAVGDGEQAVSYLSGEGGYADRAAHPLPALLLLDLKMPRMDGFEVLRWLRARTDGLRRLPVAVLTSSAENPDIHRAYDAGANSYLVKPPTFDGLHEMVRALGLYWEGQNRGPQMDGGIGA
jgi:CheY-like chemotaxis protein